MVAIQHQAARRGENFPVASWVLPKQARGPILAFYDFARGADDIADDPEIPAEDRYNALKTLHDAIENHRKNLMPPWALPYYEVSHQGFMRAEHGQNLLVAFIQDTQKNRYQNLDELLNYCRYSAVPVGRAVLDICREGDADLNAADDCCIVLQLLNHMQDIKKDYQRLNRIYLPKEWMQEHHVSESDLEAVACSEGLRQCIDQILNYCEKQMLLIRQLPHTISDLRLRFELAFIIEIADALCQQLRRQDPLTTRVRLSGFKKIRCVLRAFRAIT